MFTCMIVCGRFACTLWVQLDKTLWLTRDTASWLRLTLAVPAISSLCPSYLCQGHMHAPCFIIVHTYASQQKKSSFLGGAWIHSVNRQEACCFYLDHVQHRICHANPASMASVAPW